MLNNIIFIVKTQRCVKLPKLTYLIFKRIDGSIAEFKNICIKLLHNLQKYELTLILEEQERLLKIKKLPNTEEDQELVNFSHRDKKKSDN